MVFVHPKDQTIPLKGNKHKRFSWKTARNIYPPRCEQLVCFCSGAPMRLFAKDSIKLVEAGESIKEIASKTGKSQGAVRRKIEMMRLEVVVQKATDSQTTTSNDSFA